MDTLPSKADRSESVKIYHRMLVPVRTISFPRVRKGAVRVLAAEVKLSPFLRLERISRLGNSSRMPGMTGIDLLKRLHAEGDHPSVLMISGRIEPSVVLRAEHLGAAMLKKPVPDEHLVFWIEQMSRPRRKRRKWTAAPADPSYDCLRMSSFQRLNSYSF